MKVESKGPLGFTRGSASVELLDEPAGTRMKYRADMQIGGKVAGIGQRLLDQVARMLTRQGLEALSREMEARLSLAVGSTSASIGLATAPTVDGELVADDGTATAAGDGIDAQIDDAEASSGSDDSADHDSGDISQEVEREAKGISDPPTEDGVPIDTMTPTEDAVTPGAPVAPGIPDDAEPVADLDQRLPPGTV
jgi:hypothetical protein